MHDYFYHNLGQTLTLTAADGSDLNLQPTEELAFAGAPLILAFRHPDVKLGGSGALYILLRRKSSNHFLTIEKTVASSTSAYPHTGILLFIVQS